MRNGHVDYAPTAVAASVLVQQLTAVDYGWLPDTMLQKQSYWFTPDPRHDAWCVYDEKHSASHLCIDILP